MESTDTGAAPSDYYFGSDGQSDQMDCEDIVETNHSAPVRLGDTWLIGARTDTGDINDDLSSEPSRRVSRLSFKQIFHLKFSIVAPRSWGSETRGLLGLGALWQPGIFKVLSPLPLQAQCDSRATGRLGSQDRWHWWSLRAQWSCYDQRAGAAGWG